MKTDSVQQVQDKVEAVEMNTFMTREREWARDGMNSQSVFLKISELDSFADKLIRKSNSWTT